MPRIYMNQRTLETTADMKQVNEWTDAGETVSVYEKTSELW